jgi:mono/diheme cytochrome c family protein
MIKKILKWTGLTVLALILLSVVTIAFRQNLKYDAPYPKIKASKDSAVIARGREIILGAGNCVVCHATANADSLLQLGQEVPLSGGKKFDIPLGSFYIKNLTSDSATGIGAIKDEEIARVIRYGVNPDNTAVLMPYQNFNDDDLTAIISYLRTQKPVHNEVPPHKFNVMGKVVKAFFMKPAGLEKPIAQIVKRDTTAEYGQYLALNVSDCKGCHTNGSMMGDETGVAFSGGLEMEDPTGKQKLVTPNLTPHPTGRIYKWSQQDFINRFRKGKLIAASEMPWESFKRMSDNDLIAVYKFLHSLKPTPFNTPLEKN